MKTQIKTIIQIALLVPAFILLSACNNKKSNNTSATALTNQCIQTQTGQQVDPTYCQQGQYGYSYSNGYNNQYGGQYGNQYGGQYGQQQYGGQYQRIQCSGQMYIAPMGAQQFTMTYCQGYNCSGAYAWVNGQYAICN